MILERTIIRFFEDLNRMILFLQKEEMKWEMNYRLKLSRFFNLDNWQMFSAFKIRDIEFQFRHF